MVTTIQISDEVKKKLDEIKLIPRESYNSIIGFVLEDSLELKESIKKDLGESLKRVKSGKMISHKEMKKRLNL